MSTELRQLSTLPELVRAELDDVELELVRGGLRESSMSRYLGPARAWKRYCADRAEPFWDAPTRTLLGWLDWRVRNSQSPRSALKMSLAAARFLQRGYCIVHEIEAVPYTTKARIQLDAFARSCTLNTTTPIKKARPLRLDELDAFVQLVRDDTSGRTGISPRQGRALAERDASLAVLGWWGALRPDDCSRLRWPDVHVAPLGVELHMAVSKTTEAVLALAARPECPRLCPVQAVRALQRLKAEDLRPSDRPGWVDEDLLFQLASGDNVGRRLVTLFRRYGFDNGYTGHSLRAGFTTECAVQGIPDKLVQQHGRWRSAQQHAEYVRLARLWEDTPTLLVRVAA